MNYEEFEKLYNKITGNNFMSTRRQEMFYEFVVESMSEALGEPIYIKVLYELIRLASKKSGKDLNYYFDSLKRLGERK